MKLTVSYINPFLAISVAFSVPGMTQPSLHSSFMVVGEKVFRDVKKTNLYYYIPFGYKLAADLSGKPLFTMTQMRYTGTRSTGDQGVLKYSNLLQFKIIVDGSKQKRLATVKAALKVSNPNADLQMLPVKKFFSILVFASSSAPSSMNDSVSLVKADLVEAADENATVNNSYWNERTVSLRLSNADAQLVEAALKHRQSVMSFSYAICTAFAEKTSDGLSITGTDSLKKKVADYFNDMMNPAKDTVTNIMLVKADAISLAVNLDQWPSLIQQVDINERVPAKYALFDVYCYDFNQELRADLFEKKIDIKATHVNGTEITSSYTFSEGRPEVYAKSIRFPYAIRFDKPFYYRVLEISRDGEIMTGAWNEKTIWSELIDITSTPDKVVLKAKPIETEQ